MSSRGPTPPSLLLVLAWVTTLMVAPACSSPPRGQTAPAKDYNTLTAAEISQRSFYSAYDAVQTLRPNWFNARGGADPVQIYIDDNHAGGLDVLRTIRISSIALLRHIDGIQAPARYGAGHTGGVILVTTRAAGR